MTLLDFYDVLDIELQAIIDSNSTDERFVRCNQINQKKGLAFMVWFLDFYGNRPIYARYITDGDDDTSCDMIFSIPNHEGKQVYYVVQSKWCAKTNVKKGISSHELKMTLDDFRLVYSGQKKVSKRNPIFNEKYEALKEHLANNGEVKFVFLSLAMPNPSVLENINAFEKQIAPLEIIDIERLRRDFIERKYKEIKPTNPLEYDYNPEIETIILPIEQLDDDKNFLHINRPFESYIFLVRPKAIFDLFDKYGFKLFFQNIRNPLIISEYNQDIERTLRQNPDDFWYFNNGITAITRKLPKKVQITATKLEIQGLQIINGAQTVYAAYKAYKEAKNGERDRLNQALITLRLVNSINQDFDINITRFTNQQNPTIARDFWANDPTQKRLQAASFDTNYWYETRRGEFRTVPNGIKVVANEDFIEPYLDFYRDIPQTISVNNDKSIMLAYDNEEHKNYFSKENYTLLFNDKLMYSSLLMAFLIDRSLKDNKIDTPKVLKYFIRIILEKLFPQDTEKQVINNIEKGLIIKVYRFIVNEINKNIDSKKEQSMFPNFSNYVISLSDIEKY